MNQLFREYKCGTRCNIYQEWRRKRVKRIDAGPKQGFTSCWDLKIGIMNLKIKGQCWANLDLKDSNNILAPQHPGACLIKGLKRFGRKMVIMFKKKATLINDKQTNTKLRYLVLVMWIVKKQTKAKTNVLHAHCEECVPRRKYFSQCERENLSSQPVQTYNTHTEQQRKA